MLLAPAALPTRSARRAEHGVLRRRDRHRDADPGHDERREQRRVGQRRRPRPAASQAMPAACRSSPVTISGRSPMRSASAPGDRRDGQERRRPGQQPQAGLERAVAERGLQELGEEEHGAEQRREGEEDRGVAGARTTGRRNRRSGSIGSGARRSQATNAGHERRGPPRAWRSPRRCPSRPRCARTRPQTTPNAPAVIRREAAAGRAPCSRTVALVASCAARAARRPGRSGR